MKINAIVLALVLQISVYGYLFSDRRIIRLIISNRSVSEFISLSVSANRSSNDLLTTGESPHNAPPDDDSIGIIFLLFTNMIPWPRNRNVKFLSKAVSIIRLPSSDMNFGLKMKNSSIEYDALPSFDPSAVNFHSLLIEIVRSQDTRQNTGQSEDNYSNEIALHFWLIFFCTVNGLLFHFSFFFQYPLILLLLVALIIQNVAAYLLNFLVDRSAVD